jgi:hypothetical protein
MVQANYIPWMITGSHLFLLDMGLSICHHFEFNYILNLYVLSMCFVRYRNQIVCTICNAAPTLFFRLGKF